MFFRQDPEKENTPLHKAILARDNAHALELLQTISKQDLNKQSIGNTPLMLALKTANFEVARAILQHDDVDVVPSLYHSGVCDLRGVSPLHLACAWREPEIINLILDKYIHYLKYWSGGEVTFDPNFSIEEHGEDFGIRVKLKLDQFPGHNEYRKQLVANRTLGKIYLEAYKIENLHSDIEMRGFNKSIIDSDKLVLDFAPELTDALLFHSKAICLNLGLLTEDKFKDSPSSQYTFAKHLMTGLQAIIEYRNNKPVDEKIAISLQGKAPTDNKKATQITKI